MSEKPVPEISELNREYFEGCMEGELRVRTCNACGARFRFAHALCPQCWSADMSWERVSGRATVSHFTVVHQAPVPAFQAESPYVLAMVELDEGVRMMTNIVGCDPESVIIGMKVAVGFEARGDLLIPVFAPI
ncbi:MAG: Zn-ribbon domain-containing OB-fold protein [Novosphingobium sp.]